VKPTIALFVHHPEASLPSCNGIIQALSTDYNIKLFNEDYIVPNTFNNTDMVIFPGGVGDADMFDEFFDNIETQVIRDYIARGGRYLGICMGAYWAGHHYFNILNQTDAVQYIVQPTAEINRDGEAVLSVNWQGTSQNMFFYDGTAFVGNQNQFQTVATYANGMPMAIIQGRIGLIGCHPESLPYWYEEPLNEMQHWHEGRHHQLLLDFVNHLFSLELAN
jgi:glutamine amidotransferase-like uncharacterized protein